MAYSGILRQVRLIDPQQGWDQVGDLWIEQGRIEQVGFPLTTFPADVPVLSGEGWVVGPGLVDLYAHAGEPGYEQRESQSSLAAAALAGGYTRVGILPTTDPVMDQAELLHSWQPRSLQGQLHPQWLPLAAFSQHAQGSQLTNLMELAAAGAVGFCDDRSLPAWGLLRRVLEYAQMTTKPVLLWPRWVDLVQGGVMQEGDWSLRLGLPGIPSTAETTAVAALLELCRQTTTPVHLMRLSQARSVELLRQSLTFAVTASTSWMHLLLTDADIARYSYDSSLRLEPPLGTTVDRAALRQGVAEGLLAISTDHSPFTFEEKTVPFGVAPPGAIGLELALPLLWQELVVGEHLSALSLWTALSQYPARCLGLEPGSLRPGSLADLVIFDPHQSWLVTAETLCSRGRNTPWYGQSIVGKVIKTLVAGRESHRGLETDRHHDPLAQRAAREES